MIKDKEREKRDSENYGGSIINSHILLNKNKRTATLPIYKPYQLVFEPAPKQKWHKQLIALIPPLGHELDCPIEFAQFPYAKYEWLRIMELNKKSGIIKPCHREILYGYCLMVERRKRCMLEWDGDTDYSVVKEKNGKVQARMDYLNYEIERLNRDIYLVGKKLGLFNMKNTEVVDNGCSGEWEEECDGDCEEYETEIGIESRFTAPRNNSDLFD